MERQFLEHLSMLTTKVAELERKVEFILKALNLEYQEESVQPEYPKVEALLRQGRKLEAIQAY